MMWLLLGLVAISLLAVATPTLDGRCKCGSPFCTWEIETDAWVVERFYRPGPDDVLMLMAAQMNEELERAIFAGIDMVAVYERAPTTYGLQANL